jgi:pimeloyl-ACP methyl ester carboxylesterase
MWKTDARGARCARGPRWAVVGLLLAATCAQGAEVRTELVSVMTPDRVRLAGALHRPVSAAAGAPGVLVVHGFGGNFYEGVNAFLPQGLAERGVPVLALNMRDHDNPPRRGRFEDNRTDVEAGVSILARHAPHGIVVIGHSLGTNRVLYYHAEAQDPRVRGLVLVAGPGNAFEWNAALFGRERALAQVMEARRLIDGGKPGEWMPIDLGPLGKTWYTAEYLWSLRGPASRSDPFTNIARVRAPVLIVHGTGDRLADHPVADRLKAAAQGSAVTLVKIPGAGHGFGEHPAELIHAVADWLAGLGRP